MLLVADAALAGEHAAALGALLCALLWANPDAWFSVRARWWRAYLRWRVVTALRSARSPWRRDSARDRTPRRRKVLRRPRPPAA